MKPMRFLAAVLIVVATTRELSFAQKLNVNGSPPNELDRVRLLRVPDGGIQPQAAVDSEGTLHLIYFKGAAENGNLFYVRQNAGSSVFSKAIPVNSQTDSAVAKGSIRGAQLAIGQANRVHVAWNGSRSAAPKGPDGKSAPLLYSRLNDAGTEFEPQRNMITEAYGLDGGASVAADANGHVYLVWHASPESGDNASRRVYLIHSIDSGRTFSKERPIDAEKLGACGCCSLKAFAEDGGRFHVMYRAARLNIHRDMLLLSSNDHGETFNSRLLNRWHAPTCPMSSEAFADCNGHTVAAWEGDGQVFYSPLRINGKEEVVNPIPAAGKGKSRKHPALAVNAQGEVLFAWDKGTGWNQGGSLEWQIYDAEGRPLKSRGQASSIPVWSFPAAVAEPDGSFVVIY